MTTVRVIRQNRFSGTVRVPGDKSASHRAVLLSALADGASVITGLSKGEDVAGTAAIVEALGAIVERHGDEVHIDGPSHGLRAAQAPLDCGNSGTTIRLLSGIVSAIEGHHKLVGDPSLSKRPMDRVAIPLRQMGAAIQGVGDREVPPLSITGQPLFGIDYEVPVPSAQVKSAVLLAGLFASGETIVRERMRTRTATEDMLRQAGVTVSSFDEGEGRVITLTPGRPTAQQWAVPSDPSQAAFFVVLGALAGDASIQILDVEAAPERIGFVPVLRRMGAQIVGDLSGATTTLTANSSNLTATEIHAREIPSVDEAPILAIAASAATGVTAFRDMGELRLKESDRFEGCLALARGVGAKAWSDGDDFFIEGLGSASSFLDFSIEAGLDHRIVMSAAVAGAAGNGATIAGADTVASSYPGFFDDLASLR